MELFQARDLVHAAMICLEAIPNPIFAPVDEDLQEAYEHLENAIGQLEMAVKEQRDLEAAADDVAGDHSAG